MKKIFSVNKFFISFCVFFILVWVALQTVSYMRLTDMAKVDAERTLAWAWPDQNIRSSIKIYEAKILKKDHNAAIVKILADQSFEPVGDNSPSFAVLPSTHLNKQGMQIVDDSKCAVTLTYYRTNSQWFLGRVECE